MENAHHWPSNFPELGSGTNSLAKLIIEKSGNRIEVSVYGGKELAARDKHSARGYNTFGKFRKQVVDWHNIPELAYYNARNL